ncbi:cupin domain-containing protein [Cohnella sp. CFH 77786]|uniref:quercetin 2,3-dioxygenase n=1 Tax=Cohnella sp. CFH 77786 TaxID=2662265 RepID=UPI001C60846D|nr:quercetin 2,3-dioxygenase [Cohnella sp. CFH 77786]MBW5447665.1 cupin domain-containing protein [Cohnella sp. CFH 77786]
MKTEMKPKILSREEGDHMWYLGNLSTVKANAEHTGGQFSLVEDLMAPGYETPYHIHRKEDETFYLLEGEMEIILDGRKYQAKADHFAFLPRNIPHGFRIVGDRPARMLVMIHPSGFDRFFAELGEPAQRLELPPQVEPDIPKLLETAKKYEVEILGPLDLFITE